MSKSTLALIFGLLLVAVLLGYNYFFQPFADLSQYVDQLQSPVTEVVSDTPNSDPASEIIAELSAEAKIAQLMAVAYNIEAQLVTPQLQATTSAELATPLSELPQSQQEWIISHQPGTVVLFGTKVSTQSAQLALDKLQIVADNPLQPIIAVDHEGGTVQRLSGTGFTVLPSLRQQCAIDITEAVTSWQQSAQELSNLGVDLVFAPVVDVAAANPVLGARTCSADPEQVAEYAYGFIAAFQEQGITAVAKHFPGIGNTTLDLHRSFDRVVIEREDALVFRSLLDKVANLGVMVAHVGVENQFPDVPCTLSQPCVGELTSVYPDRLIFTDDLAMPAAAYVAEGESPKSLPQISLEALNAGNTVLMFGPDVTTQELDEVQTRLVAEYENNPDFKERVDKQIQKVINWKLDNE